MHDDILHSAVPQFFYILEMNEGEKLNDKKKEVPPWKCNLPVQRVSS